MRKAIRLSALTIAAGMLCACSSATDWLSRPPEKEPPPAAAEKLVGLGLYLETMRKLSEGDVAEQAETFEGANNAYERAATTSNRLRLALALGTPGHPSSDAVRSQRMLSELVASPEALLPEELWLSLIHLREVEERLILETQNRRLQNDAATNQRDRDAAANRRLRNVLNENDRLKRELAETQSKLDAIATIERSIINRSENGDGSR